MIQAPNGRRPRGRHHGGGDRNRGHGGGQNGNAGGGAHQGNNNRPRSAASLRHQNFDSNCIDVRVRGNAWQVHEKYQALARDAASAGDRIAAENYLQHAEHYYRIIEAINEATAAEQPQQQPQRAGAGAQPPASYGQQPETPANYYGTTGGLQQPSGEAAPEFNSNTDAASAQGEATVQRPAVPAPFFTPEEIDEQSSPEPIAARR